MTEKSGEKRAGRTAVGSREDRLKTALKANMARRKAQARARRNDGPDQDPHRAKKD